VRAVVSRAGPHRGELFVAPARSFPCARVRTGTNVRLLCSHVTASVVCEREATHAALALGEASSCFVRSIGFLSRGLLAAARWTKFHGDKLITNVVVFSLHCATLCAARPLSACGEEVGRWQCWRWRSRTWGASRSLAGPKSCVDPCCCGLHCASLSTVALSIIARLARRGDEGCAGGRASPPPAFQERAGAGAGAGVRRGRVHVLFLLVPLHALTFAR
jgi:hypothetical protein